MAENAFVRIDDWARAQELADSLSPDQLHCALDRYAAQCCPVSDAFGQSYHWRLMQVEYATYLAFRSTTSLAQLYEQLIRETVLSVKGEQIARFLGRQITPLLAQEIGSQFSSRIEGTCVKHRFGKCSIKMYDKCGIVLRIETTTNDVSFFRHHRKNPSVNIAGIRRAGLLPNLEMFSPGRLSRQLRRLLDIGVIKRITGTYRYYLTKAGRAATAAAERLKQATIVPAMI
jgi:hypothetical protein